MLTGYDVWRSNRWTKIFLNIDYQAGIDELIKNEMISIAERNLDEIGLAQFKRYLDLYYTKEGPFRMSRSFEF